VAEPVDPAADWRCTRGNVRDVTYREYDPAADTHTTAPGDECKGVRGPARVSEESGRSVTRRAWTLAGLAARPVLRSLIVDGDDSWVIETVTPNPAAETVWQVDSYKG
jgi:hypothetical protein